MKKYLIIFAFAILGLLSSCTHKDLCYNHNVHAHRYHINVIADYRCVWEERISGPDWDLEWPEHYLPYESFLPGKPSGLRVINFGESGQSNIHNVPADGGLVYLYEGYNDLLFYNNDTEYIIFTREADKASTRASTRTRTRASYKGSEFANEGEPTVAAPDMLYANYIERHMAEKVLSPSDIEITLQPLVFTYKIRYEFESGLEYVSTTRGALSGMAGSVLMNTGVTAADPATILYDCEMTEYGARAKVMSFGIPAYPNENYQPKAGNKHALNLEVMLKNGNVINYDFDVTDQVSIQPHGGVIVVKGIVVEKEEGMQGSGAFDVDVNDWGDYEDVPIPL